MHGVMFGDTCNVGTDDMIYGRRTVRSHIWQHLHATLLRMSLAEHGHGTVLWSAVSAPPFVLSLPVSP